MIRSELIRTDAQRSDTGRLGGTRMLRWSQEPDEVPAPRGSIGPGGGGRGAVTGGSARQGSPSPAMARLAARVEPVRATLDGSGDWELA